MVKAGTDKINESEAVRLPNALKKNPGMTLSIDPNSSTQQMIASPTSYLNQ
jgi:virulence-associated protein VagC